MKAYALVMGPRRKVLAVSDSTLVLWITGAAMLRKGSVIEGARLDTTLKEDIQLCQSAGAVIERITYTLPPIPKRKAKMSK